MILGDYLNSGETKSIEYKEFCLKHKIFSCLDKQQRCEMVRNSKLPIFFNNIILMNIYEYLQSYLPKYACSFHNMWIQDKDTTHEGYVFIGVDDFSEITGIPYKGNLNDNKPLLDKWVEDIITVNVDKCCCLSYDVNIYECEIIDSYIDDDIQDILIKYDEEKYKYRQKYMEYTNDKKKWINAINKYKSKLSTVQTNKELRDEFIKYLTTHDMYRKFEKELSGKTDIHFENVKQSKYDKDNMIHWLIKYKEKCVKHLQMTKPIRPIIPKVLNMDYCCVTQMTKLRKRWIVHNEKLCYYVIRIRIKAHNKTCNCIISYNDIKKNRRRAMTRTLLDDYNPRCHEVTI